MVGSISSSSRSDDVIKWITFQYRLWVASTVASTLKERWSFGLGILLLANRMKGAYIMDIRRKQVVWANQRRAFGKVVFAGTCEGIQCHSQVCYIGQRRNAIYFVVLRPANGQGGSQGFTHLGCEWGGETGYICLLRQKKHRIAFKAIRRSLRIGRGGPQSNPANAVGGLSDLIEQCRFVM